MKYELAENRVHELEQRHKSLDQAVSRLERRLYLTPLEQRQVTDLKKQKLRTKDLLFSLKRS
jgi:uncharacterized protein YdcH (DUF465 family)